MPPGVVPPCAAPPLFAAAAMAAGEVSLGDALSGPLRCGLCCRAVCAPTAARTCSSWRSLRRRRPVAAAAPRVPPLHLQPPRIGAACYWRRWASRAGGTTPGERSPVVTSIIGRMAAPRWGAAGWRWLSRVGRGTGSAAQAVHVPCARHITTGACSDRSSCVCAVATLRRWVPKTRSALRRSPTGASYVVVAYPAAAGLPGHALALTW